MSTLNPQRNPQLALRLDDSAPDPATRWSEGAELAYLGGIVRLTLDTVRKDALLEGEILHLPLPPQATPRQIQDRAEAWLRDAARLTRAASSRASMRPTAMLSPALKL